MEIIRIAIIEDDPVIRESLENYLGGDHGRALAELARGAAGLVVYGAR